MDLAVVFVAGLLLGGVVVGLLWQRASEAPTPLTKSVTRVLTSRKWTRPPQPGVEERPTGTWITWVDARGNLLARKQVWGTLPERMVQYHGRQAPVTFVRDGVDFSGAPQYRIEA